MQTSLLKKDLRQKLYICPEKSTRMGAWLLKTNLMSNCASETITFSQKYRTPVKKVFLILKS